jgi:hypothetical protein
MTDVEQSDIEDQMIAALTKLRDRGATRDQVLEALETAVLVLGEEEENAASE